MASRCRCPPASSAACDQRVGRMLSAVLTGGHRAPASSARRTHARQPVGAQQQARRRGGQSSCKQIRRAIRLRRAQRAGDDNCARGCGLGLAHGDQVPRDHQLALPASDPCVICAMIAPSRSQIGAAVAHVRDVERLFVARHRHGEAWCPCLLIAVVAPAHSR